MKWGSAYLCLNVEWTENRRKESRFGVEVEVEVRFGAGAEIVHRVWDVVLPRCQLFKERRK